ncbi:IucA/IucC family protein [Aquimarina sp. W85]|uniref:IucA/IucC family protein n=1 Tax=Aquimarina rhodophyticola TaxID=3342246 RepID=UPI003670FA47
MTLNSAIASSHDANLITHLEPTVWQQANRLLIKKALSEFAHELVLLPKLTEKLDTSYDIYEVIADNSTYQYRFEAKKMSLDHWEIKPNSIHKYQQGVAKPLDALLFITEFRKTLGIPEHLLATYMQEIISTLYSAAFKIKNENRTAKELVFSSFQTVEHAMFEGHPCFVANNGRIGFASSDFGDYAPEANKNFNIVWLAGHKDRATYTAVKGYEYNTLMRKELGVTQIARFNKKLEAMGLIMESYVFIPVHPWQWDHKITSLFAPEIANQNLVYLGRSEDEYSAQQSIRTLYNQSNPHKLYTKTALSILNMGFMRGLSPYYMQSTPPITTWISKLLEQDTFLTKKGFTMLEEVATVGYTNTYFEVLGKTDAHNKMLSALWRETPNSKIKEGQKTLTMAAFLHVDSTNNSFLKECIQASSLPIETWVRQYLDVYFSPILHCFYAYELVFMPHGENLIMVMENHVPVKSLMKDITEEVIVFNPDAKLPKPVDRLYTETSDTMKILTIFTDVFDCFFRFMSAILETHTKFPQYEFWKLVAQNIYAYQDEHPEFSEKFERYDLFTPQFDRCCLNRLQLANTQQMLNLADPIESLILEGVLENPIFPFKKNSGTK